MSGLSEMCSPSSWIPYRCEELFLYAKAIYSAMIWGREVNEQNRIIQEKNNSVK